MHKITLDDPNTVIRRQFDEDNNATRVVIVGGVLPEFNADIKLPELLCVQF